MIITKDSNEDVTIFIPDEKIIYPRFLRTNWKAHSINNFKDFFDTMGIVNETQ